MLVHLLHAILLTLLCVLPLQSGQSSGGRVQLGSELSGFVGATPVGSHQPFDDRKGGRRFDLLGAQRGANRLDQGQVETHKLSLQDLALRGTPRILAGLVPGAGTAPPDQVREPHSEDGTECDCKHGLHDGCSKDSVRWKTGRLLPQATHALVAWLGELLKFTTPGQVGCPVAQTMRNL